MKDTYPYNWYEIAKEVKDHSEWKCERCGREHDPKSGYTLTVHHLLPVKSLCDRWNLAALCQRCHLKIQARVKMDQLFFDEIIAVSDWFKPHLDGYLKWLEEKRKKKLNAK